MRVFFLFLLVCGTLEAMTWEKKEGSFGAKVVLSSTELPIQKTLKVDLELTYPPDTHPDIASLSAHLLHHASSGPFSFVLKDQQVNPPKAKGDLLEQKISFILDPQLPGMHKLSFFNISFIPNHSEKGEKQHTLISDIFEVKVTLPPVESGFEGVSAPLLPLSLHFPLAISEKNRENLIENPHLQKNLGKENQEIVDRRSFPWVAIVISLLVILFFWFIARSPALYKKREKPVVDARLQALESLRTLQAMKLPSQKEFDRFYVELTHLVRVYIEQKTQLKAPHQTTEEFLQEMQVAPSFLPKTREALSEFLQFADLVKFAKYQPSIEECDKAFSAAENFIKD